MARKKTISPSPASAPSVHERIAAAEKALLQGATERVIVSDSDLEKIASLISDTGSTKSQLLKKAVRLGLSVMLLAPESVPEPQIGSRNACEESFDNLGGLWPEAATTQYVGGWTKLDPIPYAGFISGEMEKHYTKEVDPAPLTPTGLAEVCAVEDLETQF
jgi:hypothetical protein